MKPWVEILESRALLSSSAYPVVAGDASVLADNQHIAYDTGVLASDTASFRALIVGDNLSLKTIVAKDRSAIATAKAAVKADANDPTLLGPAQTALENATVKLSGDTASLKTKLSVDSANQRTTLRLDSQAVHIDQGFLRSDTQAATAALSADVSRITSDLAAIEARGPVSSVVVSVLEADLLAAARGQARPDASAVAHFASSLATSLNSGSLSPKQEAALARNVVDVLNSGGVPSAQTQGVIASAQALLVAGGASPANTQACVSALGALIV